MTNDKYYYPGDMIFAKGLIFQDTFKHDIRINGHPVLILTSANFGEKYYALKISGRYSYSEGLNNYYILKQNNKKRIFKTSFIDLRYIYEFECTNIPPIESVVSEKEFIEILDRLKEVQKVRKDENYKHVEQYHCLK